MLDEHDIISYLNHEGERIAFHGLSGRQPGLFFLHGFRSEMTGGKAGYLAALARTQDISFTRFDYFGHGRSSGDFIEGTIGRWLSDALAVFDQVTVGPQILVGSSLGGWLALHLALKRPERVCGLVGIAAAPDFTEDLIWPKLSAEQKRAIETDGRIEIRSSPDSEPYPLTMKMIQSGREHLLLERDLPITCPVRLLHGMEDEEVPWQTATRIAERVASRDVQITLVKDGDHRLSRDSDLDLLRRAVEQLMAGFSA